MSSTPLTLKALHATLLTMPPSTVTNIDAKAYERYEISSHRDVDGGVSQHSKKLSSDEYGDTNTINFEWGTSTAQQLLESSTELMEQHADCVVLLQRKLVLSTTFVPSEVRPAKLILPASGGTICSVSDPWDKHGAIFDTLRQLGLKQATTIQGLLTEKLDRKCRGTLGVYTIGDRLYFYKDEIFDDYPELCKHRDWKDLFQIASSAAGPLVSVCVYQCKIGEDTMRAHFGQKESLVARLVRLSLSKDVGELWWEWTESSRFVVSPVFLQK